MSGTGFLVSANRTAFQTAGVRNFKTSQTFLSILLLPLRGTLLPSFSASTGVLALNSASLNNWLAAAAAGVSLWDFPASYTALHSAASDVRRSLRRRQHSRSTSPRNRFRPVSGVRGGFPLLSLSANNLNKRLLTSDWLQDFL